MNLLDSHDTPRFLSCVSGDKDSPQAGMALHVHLPRRAAASITATRSAWTASMTPTAESRFPWDESKWDRNLLDYVKELIDLRKKNPALRRGDYKRLWSANGTYAYSRTLGDKTVVVAVNVSGSPQQINVTYEAGKESRGRSLAKRLISRWTGACISPSQPTAAWC
ncbi:MAG: cyclomaltodextrinase C-terminal domain-containing protein [Candidatus Moduliflexus flocculans]|nr:cyclomaltodextrinase C-terminal domain-containing protein [Candidatus Moduliflexus flocculans]